MCFIKVFFCIILYKSSQVFIFYRYSYFKSYFSPLPQLIFQPRKIEIKWIFFSTLREILLVVLTKRSQLYFF